MGEKWEIGDWWQKMNTDEKMNFETLYDWNSTIDNFLTLFHSHSIKN